MREILYDVSDKALTWEIEANQFELFRLFRHWPKAELHEEPELLWTITHIPFFLFNAVLHAHLAPEAVDPAILAAIGRCQDRNVPMGWFVGPATLPANLGARLEAHGFFHGDP